MFVQGSSMEPFVFGTQVEDSREKNQQLKQAITPIKQDTSLPIGGSIPIPVDFPSFQMELGLFSGNGIQVQELEIFEKSLKLKNLLRESPLQGLPQKRSSVEEWREHFNYNSPEDTFPGFWHRYKISTSSKDKTSKMVVKKQPMKNKDLLQKPKLLCLQGKSKAKSQKWIKEFLKNKEDNSNLLQESNLANSGEWFTSILKSEAEKSNWARTSDINLGFEAMVIESKLFPDPENVYDMKALNDECENVQKRELVTRNPQILIKECENREGANYGVRIPPYKGSNETNVNELAGYLDNMLQIPRKMSVMAKTMYT